MSASERMSLAPSSLASKGFKFIFEGITTVCRTCKLRAACVDGLEEGRLYEVINVNKKKRFECPLHGEVVLVSLRKSHLMVALPSGLIEGATTHYKPIECEDLLCRNFQYCRPDGIKPGDKIKVVRGVGPLNASCSKVSGYKIYEVEVK